MAEGRAGPNDWIGGIVRVARPSGSGLLQPFERQVSPLAERRVVAALSLTTTGSGRPVSDDNPEAASTAAQRATVILAYMLAGRGGLRSHPLSRDSPSFAPRDSECACLLSDIHLAFANIVDYATFCYATLKRG